MSDASKLTRAIRVNVIGGSVFLIGAGVALALAAAGVLAVNGNLILAITSACVIAALSFLTARSLRQDRDDPDGIERRFSRQALAWSAALLGVGVVAVVAVMTWGLFR